VILKTNALFVAIIEAVLLHFLVINASSPNEAPGNKSAICLK
jgi:hypothetical protein